MEKGKIEFKEKLEQLIKERPIVVLAKEFGVSRQAFYKWLKKYGIETNKPKKIEKLNEIADKLLKK